MGTSIFSARLSSRYDFNPDVLGPSLCTRFLCCCVHTLDLAPIRSFCFLIFMLGGQAILFVSLNCFVHAVMYTYYLLSVCNSVKIKSNDVFKRNITRLQLVSDIVIQALIFLFQLIFRFNSVFWAYIMDKFCWFRVVIVVIPKYFHFWVSHKVCWWSFYSWTFIATHMAVKRSLKKFNNLTIKFIYFLGLACDSTILRTKFGFQALGYNIFCFQLFEATQYESIGIY